MKDFENDLIYYPKDVYKRQAYIYTGNTCGESKGKQKSLFPHPNPFQMDGKEHQFLVRKLLVPGIAHILRNAAGAFVVLSLIHI